MSATVRTLACVAVLSAALVAAPAAPAAVYELTGTFHAEGVSGTGRVSVKVVVRRGNPVRIKDLEFKKLPARCNVSETPGSPVFEPAGTLSGSAGTNSNGDGIEFGRRLQWFSYPNKGARMVSMTGRLSKSGKRISKGRLEVGNNKACQQAVGTFTAKK